MKKTIIHLPTWFPNDLSPFSGIFTKKQIEAINCFDDRDHIALSWHNTVNATLRNPLSFIQSFINLFKKDVITVEESVVHYKFHYFHSHELLFGSNETRLFNRIRKIILALQAERKVELIHAHITFPAAYIAEIIKSDMHIPYVITEQMSPFPFPFFMKDLQRKIINPIRQSSVIAAVGNYQALEIEKCTGVKAIVIPNLVDEREFKPGARKKSSEVFEFLLVGLLTEQKGVDILLQSVKLLVDKGIVNFVLKIGGNGAIITDLKEQMNSLHIDRYVEWLGDIGRDRILEAYTNCDAFISSSRHESFGVAIVEAMACGKPVVATKCGGPEDTVNEINGILVEKEDAVALANGMAWMMENIDTFDPGKIRQDFMDKYSREKIANAYIGVYSQVINF